jgi:hypothetical protein
MNILLKRKLSSVIPSESIAKNIGKEKSNSFCNTTSRNHNKNGNKNQNINADKKIKDTKQTNKKYHNEDCNENAYKRQKKTHYNVKMEPISFSSTSMVSLKVGADSAYLPKRIREVVWNTYNGETYSSKCYVPWCSNIINVFNYQVGHDIPESKGGTYDIGNLLPICSNCNLSMGNKWTIQEWGKLVNHDKQSTEQPANEQPAKEQPAKEQHNKTDLQVSSVITPETTYKITFITLLLLTLNFMIF